jgi:hypothetical protein
LKENDQMRIRWNLQEMRAKLLSMRPKKKYKKLVDFSIVFFVIFCLYFLTSSHRLTWTNFGNDGGDFWSAILTNGVPHPTGYPTYLLLGWLFQRFPFGDPYFKAVLLSYLPAAIAAGLLSAWVASQRNGHRISGVVTGLLWGMSPALWSQAIIIEVYALQSLFSVLALWWFTLLLRKTPLFPEWLLYVLAFGFGLGAGNHSTQALMLPACLACLFIYAKQTKKYRQVILQLIVGCLGGLVYLALPIRASHFPPINWGNPQTLSGFLWEVSGAPYRSLLGTISANTLVGRLFSSATILREQVGALGIVLGVFGGCDLFQKDRKAFWLSLWIFSIYLAFSIGYNTADSTGYLIPSWMIFCAWSGISLDAAQAIRWKKWRLSQVIFLVIAAWLAIRIPIIIKQIMPADRYLAADMVEKALAELPANAIVVTYSELDSFPLWAYHFGLGWRKDISIIVLPLTQFKWYQDTLVHTYSRLNFTEPSEKYTNSTLWGEQVGPLNPKYVICKSLVQTQGKLEITYTCTNGTKINAIP